MDEVKYAEQLLEAEITKDEINVQKIMLLKLLPFVYNESSSSLFEEFLILHVDLICQWLEKMPKDGLRFVRTRICILQLQDNATKVYTHLQNVQSALT